MELRHVGVPPTVVPHLRLHPFLLNNRANRQAQIALDFRVTEVDFFARVVVEDLGVYRVLGDVVKTPTGELV